MPNVVEEIPSELRSEVDAALAWLNSERQSSFRVTAIVDPEEALARRGDAEFELGLVLCQGDLCLREQICIRRSGGEIHFASAGSELPSDDPPPHLDPPAGSRTGWLAEQLGRHAFVVVVFYRGFW